MYPFSLDVRFFFFLWSERPSFRKRIVKEENNLKSDDDADKQDSGQDPLLCGKDRPGVAEAKEVHPDDDNENPEEIQTGKKEKDFRYAYVSVLEFFFIPVGFFGSHFLSLPSLMTEGL